jgi:hypothetical protein
MALHDIILSRDLWNQIGPVSRYYHPDLGYDLTYLELWTSYGNSILTLGLCGVVLAWLRRFRPAAEALPSSAR